MTEKRTKRDNFNELMTIVIGAKSIEECNVELLKTFITHEIELLNRKHSSDNVNSATTKRRAENAIYQEAILEILREANKPLTIKAIQSLATAPINDFSTSKMSALLTALKRENKVERSEVKKVIYWEFKRVEKGD